MPVRSIAAAKGPTASEAIDKGKTLKIALFILLQMSIRLFKIVDSKDLSTSLSTKLYSIDRSIRAGVNCIRFDYEMAYGDKNCRLPWSINLADPGTKADSPLY